MLSTPVNGELRFLRGGVYEVSLSGCFSLDESESPNKETQRELGAEDSCRKYGIRYSYVVSVFHSKLVSRP